MADLKNDFFSVYADDLIESRILLDVQFMGSFLTQLKFIFSLLMKIILVHLKSFIKSI